MHTVGGSVLTVAGVLVMVVGVVDIRLTSVVVGVVVVMTPVEMEVFTNSC
jgi:hypothetical protein